MVLLVNISATPHQWHNERGAGPSAVHMQLDVAVYYVGSPRTRARPLVSIGRPTLGSRLCGAESMLLWLC